MRISDWSSDVCSSDLIDPAKARTPTRDELRQLERSVVLRNENRDLRTLRSHILDLPAENTHVEIWRCGNEAGDLADRKSVVEGKSVSVRVDLGSRCIIKKKKTTKRNL